MRWVSECLGVRFWRVGTNFTIGKALRFGAFFKYLFDNYENYDKLWRKFQRNAKFSRNFRFFARAMGKIRIIIYMGIDPQPRKNENFILGFLEIFDEFSFKIQ